MSTDPVRKWLSALGTLCATNAPEAEAARRVEAYATMLASEYQPWAFSRRSLEAVARQCKFWPAYGELCDLLSAWCRDNKPAQSVPLLTGPAELSPAEYRAKKDQEDRDWWEDYLANLSERPNADYRWVRAMEISLQVTQDDSHPRPWIIPLLYAITKQAEKDGADTTNRKLNAPVPYPVQGEAVVIAQPRRVPGYRSDFAFQREDA